MNVKIAVALIPEHTPEIVSRMTHIADQFELPLINFNERGDEFDYLLTLNAHNHFGLRKRGSKSVFRVDFSAKNLLYRSKHASRRNELLLRAIGIKANQTPSLVDATAGLGRDSFILATSGYSVTLLERVPIIHLLLQDAIAHAGKIPYLADIMPRLKLIQTDAMIWLSNNQVDVVYLDPMFPKRQKSASVKKENLILQDLQPLEDSKNPQHLLSAALTCASKRVVIKRPRLSEFVANQKPSFSLNGNSCRFDVYLV